jgi:HNH endonuclease
VTVSDVRDAHRAACSVAGCERLWVARGWCGAHYMELHDRGICGASDCEYPAKIASLCWAHYSRQRRGAPLDGPIKRKNPKGEGGLRSGYHVLVKDGQQSYTHRLVMEQMVGRPLHQFENVHHINGIRSDNRPENLELWVTWQPNGQRVSDLVDFIATYYAAEVTAAIQEKK